MSQIKCLALGLITTDLQVGEKLSFQDLKLKVLQGPGLAKHVPEKQETMFPLHIYGPQGKAPGPQR